jgi:CubicO group peptidase (beta-lactamase class C family)
MSRMPVVSPWCRPAVLLLCLAIQPVVAAESLDFSAVDQRALAAVAAGDTPSIAFAISRNGEILHEGAFGLADREAGREATVHTAYPLASATKPITATALMVLHERQGLDLAQPLHAALPAVAVRGDGADAITLTQLLTHTSGLGTYATIRYGDDIAATPPTSADLGSYAVVVNRPGRIAEYSNLGYGLLGEVVARHARLPFADAVENLVFAPLGMDDAFVDTPRRGQIDVAAHYDGTSARLPPLRNNTPGAGNVNASARDMIRFAMLHAGAAGEQPLSRAGVAAMQARHDTAFQHYYGDAYYGLGWYVRVEGGRRTVWHEGGMPGASTIVKLLPDDGIAVVVLVNRSDANELSQAVADSLIGVALPGHTAQPLDAVAGYAPLTDQPGFSGTWRGTVHVDGVDVDCTLELGADGSGRFHHQAPGQAPAESVVRAIVKGDSFISAIPGRLPSADIAADDEPLLLLKLVRNDDRFSGALVAYSSQERLEYLLPFPIQLRRQIQANPSATRPRTPPAR